MSQLTSRRMSLGPSQYQPEAPGPIDLLDQETSHPEEFKRFWLGLGLALVAAAVFWTVIALAVVRAL